MLALMREHDADQTLLERDAEERRRRGVTFRELAGEYLRWLEDVKGAKPSTLRDHRSLLAEPGQAYRRGAGASRGQIMSALGERPAREVTTREVEDLLRSISSTGVAPRTVNKARQLVCAVFNYGTRASTYGLPANPAQHADRRRDPDVATLAFYSPEQIETLASALAAGAHRDPSRPALRSDEVVARAREDAQDADLIRVAAYAGLRRGELVALHWRDVDFAGRKLIVRRSLSGETEVRSTKSRRARQVPLPDQAATALERLCQRGDFTGPDDYVFASRLGRRLDPSALRRRFERARDAAASSPCASMTSATPTAPSLSPAASTLRASRRRWATRTSPRRSAICMPDRLVSWRTASLVRSAACQRPSSAMPRNQREWIKALEDEGWVRERGGKHQVKMVKPGRRPITLPQHKGRTYSKGLDGAIRRQAGL